jgi:hypothetical protein
MRVSTRVPQSKRFKNMRIPVLLFFLAVSIPCPFAAEAAALGSSSGTQLQAQAAPIRPGEEAGATSSLPDSASAKTIREALLKENFSYAPKSLIDPFSAFIAPADSTPPTIASEDEDLGAPAEPQRPLTPLQKMKISEIEKGLKAITWGDLGRKAIIEDSAGKGYIIGIGTPVGEKNGVVTEIFNDHLVIQQEYWDRKAKRMIPQNYVVKLVKVKAK